MARLQAAVDYCAFVTASFQLASWFSAGVACVALAGLT
jgi:hypothetical protein